MKILVCKKVINESRKPIRRNPLITRTLYYSKDMESFATGLRRIQNFCDGAGVKVEYYGDRYGFTVRFHRHCGEGWAEVIQAENSNETQNEPQTQNQTQNGTQNGVGPQNGPQNGPQTKVITLKERVVELILQNNKITKREMADELSVGISMIKRILKELPNVHYVGSSKSGHWVNDDENRE